MQFQIPQFIEVEDKIVGPMTLKQFLWVAGAAAGSFMLFFILNFYLWLLFSIFLAGFGLAFAFVKYNSQPLPKIAWLFFMYLWQPRLYLWQREEEWNEIKVAESPKESFGLTAAKFVRDMIPKEMPNVMKLWHDLTTSKNPIPKREKILRQPTTELPKEKYQIFRKATGEKDIARRVDYR